MRREYLIAILLAVAAFPAGAALMVAPEYLHLTGPAVPLTFWGGIGLTLSLIAIAAFVAYRGTAKGDKPQLSPFSNMARDVSLLDAIWRVYMGKWGERKTIPRDALERRDPEALKFCKACLDIRQRAFEGTLPLWAQRENSPLYEPLPLDFWLNRQLLPQIIMNADWNEVWVTYTHALVPGEVPYGRSTEWQNFMTNRERTEKLWPREADV